MRIVGAGGHGRVAADAWCSAGGEVLGFHDDDRQAAIRSGVIFLGPVMGAFSCDEFIHIAIGRNAVRKHLAEQLSDSRCPPVIHRQTVVSPGARIEPGALVCAGAVIQTGAVIGRHSIVNSLTLVEHDCAIGEFVHLAPGVRLAGNVTVGDSVLVGVGAIALPGISIGQGAVVGAGAVLVRDVPEGATVAGNPARALS